LPDTSVVVACVDPMLRLNLAGAEQRHKYQIVGFMPPANVTQSSTYQRAAGLRPVASFS
jgi:hypothetical protein